MLCVEDYLDALNWAKADSAGWKALVARADANAQGSTTLLTVRLAGQSRRVDPATRSNTSVCLTIADPDVLALDADGAGCLRQGHRLGARQGASPMTSAPIATRRRACASGAAPPSRPPISKALMPWLDWAFASQKAALPRLLPSAIALGHGEGRTFGFKSG
jgi:phosphoserine aminotransferase